MTGDAQLQVQIPQERLVLEGPSLRDRRLDPGHRCGRPLLMSFSANRCAYCPRPSFSIQSATCCIEAGPWNRAPSARIARLPDKSKAQ